jgi:hypothetical protein
MSATMEAMLDSMLPNAVIPQLKAIIEQCNCIQAMVMSRTLSSNVCDGIVFDATATAAKHAASINYRDLASLFNSNYLSGFVQDLFLRAWWSRQSSCSAGVPLPSVFFNSMASNTDTIIRDQYNWDNTMTSGSRGAWKIRRMYPDITDRAWLGLRICVTVYRHPNHWVGAYIDPLLRRVFVIDPLYSCVDYQAVFEVLWAWFCDLHVKYNRVSAPDRSTWQFHQIADFPTALRQTDGFNCGVINSGMQAFFISHGRLPGGPEFSSSQLHRLRLAIGWVGLRYCFSDECSDLALLEHVQNSISRVNSLAAVPSQLQLPACKPIPPIPPSIESGAGFCILVLLQ